MIAVMSRTSASSRDRRAITVFSGRELDMIAMPLGGIGAGCLSIGGWGQLRDWEIFGRPGKGITNEMAFFTLHARSAGSGGRSFTRVLQGPAGGPRMGPPSAAPSSAGGSGVWGRAQAAGLPHFASCTFAAHYPFADMPLADPGVPLGATLTAWSPFIPLNDHDSSIPCALFSWTIRNPTRSSWSCTLFANMTNAVGFPDSSRSLSAFRDGSAIRGIAFTSEAVPPDSPRFGSMALATTHRSVTWLNHWRRGGWFDPLTDFWRQATTGRLDESVPAEQSPEGGGDTASIGLRFRLAPGEAKTMPIVIAWHSPLQERYWGPAPQGGRRPMWKTWMASQWADAWSVAEYVLGSLPRLERETRLYDETLRATTVPEGVVQSVSQTSSTLKSPTCLRLPDGELWAWEGCHDREGCCEGSCTHVWNYQQMLPHLFPALERSLRDLEYRYNLHPDGHMGFRLPLPLGTPGDAAMHAAADGQLGGILKLYRDWRISGDDQWLARLWPAAKRSLEFAWLAWDRDQDGVAEGVQHNTYDIEFWGPNPLVGSFYLGALRAGEEIARRLGDAESAARYRRLFESGRAWIDTHLWNGEYYEQRVNLEAGRDDPYLSPAAAMSAPVFENRQPKYQLGSGCLSDQLLGQLSAEVVELGDLLDPAHIDGAASSIFRRNFRRGFFGHANVQRIYAQDEESGLVLCSWPRGGMPAFPFPYSDEVWTGIEYTTAALLAWRGRSREALEIVEAVRGRYDGTRRNPFDELECGHHYARALASYAVLCALAGFSADLGNARLAFSPRVSRRDFACFFSVGTGWGLYRQRASGAGRGSGRGAAAVARYELEVRYGSVGVRTLAVPALVRQGGGAGRAGGTATARIGTRRVAATVHRGRRGLEISLPRAERVAPGSLLVIEVRGPSGP